MINNVKERTGTKYLTNKKIIIFVLVLLIILFIAISIPNLTRTYQTYQVTSTTAELIDIADQLFQAVRHYGFERGRVNVVLSYKGSINDMSSNREFIMNQRTEGERAYNEAITKLYDREFNIETEFFLHMTHQHEKIESLRKIAAYNMTITYDERDKSFPSVWFPSMTEFIEAIESFLFQIHLYVSSTDPENSKGFRLKLDALSLRNTAGPECSRMITMNTERSPLNEEHLKELQILRTQTDMHWKEIKRIDDYLEDPALHDAVDKVDDIYFKEVQPLLDRVQHGLSDPGIEPVPQPELVDKVVKGLEAIAGIMDAAKNLTSEINYRNRNAAITDLIITSVISLSLILLVTLLMILLLNKIISPIAYLTTKMYQISNDEESIEIPYLNRQDGIGKLAKAVDLFQKYSRERKSQAEKLRIQKEKAEQATKAKSIFLANMSHEIRTPINGIMGLTEMSLDLKPTKRIRENLKLSLTTTESLLSLINDILDFEKISVNEISIINAPFNLFESISDTIELYQYMAESKNLKLSFSLKQNVPGWINADKMRIEQILRNLISNAIKFTNSGEISVSVNTAEAESIDDNNNVRLIISVKDSGCGIPEESINSIFESFKQLDSSYSKTQKGTGLGLSICYSLVRKMGGTIEVKSEVNIGSNFICTIPVEISHEIQKEKEVDIPVKSSPRKILFAEDEAINRMYLKYFLESEGHIVTFVESGTDLIIKLQEEEYDIVISDIQMFEMDGVEAVKRIRSGNHGILNPEIPIIAFTAYSSQSDRDNFISAGFTDYLSKPVNIAKLQEIIYLHTS